MGETAANVLMQKERTPFAFNLSFFFFWLTKKIFLIVFFIKNRCPCRILFFLNTRMDSVQVGHVLTHAILVDLLKSVQSQKHC